MRDPLFVRALRLRNFRNCDEADLEFSPRVNMINGANAQGKTSLLEALFLAISGRSFRTSQISDLIRYHQPFFYLETRFVKNGVEQRIRITYGDGERKILYNHSPCQSASGLLGLIPGVAMTSDDIHLVRGSPQTRRHFLDTQISQGDPLYLHHLTRYQKAMRQRNHLLRERAISSILVWEQEMATSASYLLQARLAATQDLLHFAKKRYTRLSRLNEDFAICYTTSAPTSDHAQLREYYLQHYETLRPREMQMGLTLTGPHRDDLSLLLDGREARSFASEGQQRSCVTALRLAEYDRLSHSTETSPLLLIDDLGVSLDSERIDRLVEQVMELGQVFLTHAGELWTRFPSESIHSFKSLSGRYSVIR